MKDRIPLYRIEEFTEWSRVEDYESDELSVVLLDKDNVAIAEIMYACFTTADLERFKKSSSQGVFNVV